VSDEFGMRIAEWGTSGFWNFDCGFRNEEDEQELRNSDCGVRNGQRRVESLERILKFGLRNAGWKVVSLESGVDSLRSIWNSPRLNNCRFNGV